MARQARKKPGPRAHEEVEILTAETSAVRSRALVFISHDSRDADLAEAFANLLSDVSAGTLKSFRSSDKRGAGGIEFGAEWYAAIMSQIDEATDVVALLTPQSLDRPWILYEAGVAKGKLETTVFGVALGVPLDRVSTGPFGQFQNCDDDEDSLTKLIIQLLERNPDAAPREQAVRSQVKIFRDAVAKALASRGEPSSTTPTDEQSAAKLFEEVKAMVRELPERLEFFEGRSTRRRSRRRVFHAPPLIFEELLAQQPTSPADGGAAQAWLVTISLFREDAPWAFEAGLDLYRALKSGTTAKIKNELDAYEGLLIATSRSSTIRDYFSSNEESYGILSILPETLGRAVHHLRTTLRSGHLGAPRTKPNPDLSA